MFVFMFVLLWRVCTHIRLRSLAPSIFVYVCVVIENIYTCNTGYFGYEPLFLCLCCCTGYVHM